MVIETTRIKAYRVEKQNIWNKALDYLFVLKNQLALHSTDPLTPYISLWARVKNFNPHCFFQEMVVKQKAVRTRAFRGTLFVIHQDWISQIVAALDWFYSQRIKETLRYAERLAVDKQIAGMILDLLAGGTCYTSRELKKSLELDIKGDALTILIRYLEYSKKIARTSGRTPLDATVRYGLWENLLPYHKSTDSQIGLEKVLVAYIQQFGPVTLNDICWWFPLTKLISKQTLEKIENQLKKIIIDETEYYMTKNDFEKFELYSPNENLEIVSFLPYEDHYTKAYINREWFLPKNVLPCVTEEGAMMRGQILPSVWLNGEIIGRWFLRWQDNKKTAAKIELGQIFGKETLSKNIHQKIENKRIELENFLNEKMVTMARK